MNASNLNIGVGFDIDANPKTFQFTDLTNYSAVTVDNVLGNLRAVSPTGIQFHQNTSYSSPDISYNGSPTSADFPLTQLMVGNYVFTYTVKLVQELQSILIVSNDSAAKTITLQGDYTSLIQDGTAADFNCVDSTTTSLTIVSSSYSSSTGQTTVVISETLGVLTPLALFQFEVDTFASKTFTQNYTYVQPTVCLNVQIDYCCSTATINDTTAYPSGSTITRLHTISYPVGMVTPISDITSPLQEVTIPPPIWTGVWTDIFTADIAVVDGIITVEDQVRGVKDFTVVDNAYECQIRECFQDVVNRFSSQITANPTQALTTMKWLVLANGEITAYQLAKKCGSPDQTTFLDNIKTIVKECGCNCDCAECADDTPQQVVGCCDNVGLSDFTIVITSPNNSIAIGSSTVGSTTTYTIDVDDTWFETNFLAQMNVTSIDELADVNLSIPPTVGKSLVWQGSYWSAQNAPVYLVDLVDVDVTGLANTMIMYYDSGSGAFKFKLPTVISIANCTDVLLTSLATSQILKYNGTKWVNVANTFALLSDVNTSGLTNGQAFKWDSGTSKYIPFTPATSLAELTVDVDITSPANEEILIYNGSKWTNAPAVAFTTIDNANFTSPFTNSFGFGHSVVQWAFDSYNKKVSIRGSAAQSGTGVGSPAVVFTFPDSTYWPSSTVPFRCTVGLGAANTVGFGDISASGVVTLYSYLNTDNPSTGSESGVPDGGVAFDLIEWYI